MLNYSKPSSFSILAIVVYFFVGVGCQSEGKQEEGPEERDQVNPVVLQRSETDSSPNQPTQRIQPKNAKSETEGALRVESVDGSYSRVVFQDSMAASLVQLFPYGDWSCASGDETTCAPTKGDGDYYHGHLRYTCDLYDEMAKEAQGGDCGHPDSFGSGLRKAQDAPHVRLMFQYRVSASSRILELRPLPEKSNPQRYVASFLEHHTIETAEWTSIQMEPH